MKIWGKGLLIKDRKLFKCLESIIHLLVLTFNFNHLARLVGNKGK